MTTKTTLPEVLERFKEYHKKHPAWGALHVVLDDGNVNDASVQWCVDDAASSRDDEGHELACLLLKMSRTQRLKIARLG